MIPLINIVFLLLIFFLITGTVERFAIIPINLPESENGKLLDEGHIVIVLGKHDEILLDEALLSPPELKQLLIHLLKTNPERIITIKADARLAASRLIDTMNIIRDAGGQNVSLVTQKKG